MEVWFEFDDFKDTHPLWEIPAQQEFFNGKIWKDSTPYWLTQDKKTITSSNRNRNRDPRNQPSQSSQGWGPQGSQGNPRRNNQQGGQFRHPQGRQYNQYDDQAPREYQRGYSNRDEEYQQWDQTQYDQHQYSQNSRERSSSRQGRPRERSQNRREDTPRHGNNNRNRNIDPGYGGYQ